MEKPCRVALQPLSQEAFSLYGQAHLVLAGQKPDDSGRGWQCWYPLGQLDGSPEWQIGVVRTEPRPLIVLEMERHLARAEWVLALDKPLVQTVALSCPDDGTSPDPDSFSAFLLQPGQGVLIAKGVWHGVGLPAGQKSTLYAFALSEPPDDPQENSGWVRFSKAVSMAIVP